MQKISSDFVAKMSHDLKTPVGNAMMYAELLTGDIESLAGEHPEIREQLEPLKFYCGNIYLASSKLINAIQSWGYSYQMDDGVFELNKKEIDLKKRLNDTITRNDILIRGKSLDVRVDYRSGQHLYSTDEEVMSLILDNLVTFFVGMAGNSHTIDVEVKEDSGGLLFRFYPTKPAFDKKLITNYSGNISVKDRIVPDQGILKPGGYGLIFSNLALRYIGASHGVDDETTEPRSFWFRLPLT